MGRNLRVVAVRAPRTCQVEGSGSASQAPAPSRNGGSLRFPRAGNPPGEGGREDQKSGKIIVIPISGGCGRRGPRRPIVRRGIAQRRRQLARCGHCPLVDEVASRVVEQAMSCHCIELDFDIEALLLHLRLRCLADHGLPVAGSSCAQVCHPAKAPPTRSRPPSRPAPSRRTARGTGRGCRSPRDIRGSLP
jgi:hypothetical protein